LILCAWSVIATAAPDTATEPVILTTDTEIQGNPVILPLTGNTIVVNDRTIDQSEVITCATNEGLENNSLIKAPNIYLVIGLTLLSVFLMTRKFTSKLNTREGTQYSPSAGSPLKFPI
jgi:hypothetical protein